MHTSLSKKLLAGLLSLVMVLSLVAPSMSTQAASKYTLTNKTSVKADVTYKYQLKGLATNRYAKVTRNVSGETVKYNKKAITKTTKIKGTGKTLNLYVKYSEKDKDYTGKITVKIYSKTTNKLLKTIVEKVNVKTNKEEEPVVEEATLTELKATGVKTLTATLSKEATVTAADVVVKKGSIVVTPADVKVDGTNVVITLGSKITEGTYSVTYKEVTKEVATVDEKLTSLKTVGADFAKLDTTATWSSKGGKYTDSNVTANTVAATIEYQALNQYGEPMVAEINNVVSSFGGDADWTEPTAKKNGVIEVINISSAIGLIGNTGKIIIVSKDGVSTTNDVTFNEESKLAKIELAGIISDSAKLVDAIPATKAIANYKLAFKAYDQYGYEVSKSKVEGQAISQAQVLTNVKADVDKDNNGTIDSGIIGTETVDGVEYMTFALTSSTSNPAAVAGSLQLIVVGNRFGSVINTTIKVEQRNLLKSFTMSAPDQIYNQDANEINYTAVDTEGKEITTYKDLKDLVEFDKSEYTWVKNSDGTAKLVYTPNLTESTVFPSTTSVKQNTVTSVTVTANKKFSAADQLVTTKTFTVYQKKIPTSIVKYTGSTGSTDGSIYLYKNKFVYEDQYGNTLTAKDACWSDIDVVYIYTTANSGADTFTKATYATETTSGYAEKITYVNNAKVYALLSTSKYLVDTSNVHNGTASDTKFDVSKADVTLVFKAVSTTKATNLKATYKGTLYDYIQKVSVNASKSGITAADFKVTGTVNGVSVTIPAAQVSLVSDTYVAINKDEYETAVKKATVKLNIKLVDDDNEDYYETIEGEYSYSAAAPYQYYVAGDTDPYDYINHTTTYGYYEAGKLTAADFNDYFACYDQYGDKFSTTLTYDVKLGANTDSDWSVKNPGLASCYVNVKSGFNGNTDAKAAHIFVTATSSKGLTDTIEWIVTTAETTDYAKTEATKAKAAVEAVKKTVTYATTDALVDTLLTAGNGYVSAITIPDADGVNVTVTYTDGSTSALTGFIVTDRQTYADDDVLYVADSYEAKLAAAAKTACEAYLTAATANVTTAAGYTAIGTAKSAADDAISAYDNVLAKSVTSVINKDYATEYATSYANTYTAAGTAKTGIDSAITAIKNAFVTATAADNAALVSTINGYLTGKNKDYIVSVILTTKGTNSTDDTIVTINFVDATASKSVNFTVTDVTDVPANGTNITSSFK